MIAVKSGFRSGYLGEGPRGLAMALELLRQHSIDIEEFIVDERYFVRLGCSALLQSDIDLIEHGRAVRPKRLYDYVHGHIDDEVEIIPDNSRYYPDRKSVV